MDVFMTQECSKHITFIDFIYCDVNVRKLLDELIFKMQWYNYKLQSLLAKCLSLLGQIQYNIENYLQNINYNQK